MTQIQELIKRYASGIANARINRVHSKYNIESIGSQDILDNFGVVYELVQA